jgi:riboflavin kinase/FMN adenylyltransferase
MKLVRDLSELPELNGSVVTDGMFDGVHLGHQRILQQVVNQAKQMGLPSVVLTYWPHPRYVLGGKEQRISLLSSLDEKADLIEEQGIDFLVVIPFTREFSLMSHETFVKEILVKNLKTRHLIVGYDHRFGQNRLGDIRYLISAGLQFGFDVTEIGKQEIEDIAISSTKIRYSLQHYLLDSARQFLGRPYAIRGTVVEGDKRGRTIGFPTANLQADEIDKLIPKDGVYATRCRIDGQWFDAMTNIGFRPTVDGIHHKIETHILDFQGDLYGKKIDLAFFAALRQEMKFAGLEELKNQLTLDREQCRKILLDAGT